MLSDNPVITMLGLAASASANPELIVVGPVGADPSVPATQVAKVSAAVDRAALARGGTTADAMCVLDTACLAKAGASAGAQRVIGLSVRTASATAGR